MISQMCHAKIINVTEYPQKLQAKFKIETSLKYKNFNLSQSWVYFSLKTIFGSCLFPVY